ncbi:MAG TPA: hypothetical protein VG389_23230 [Myxococcota bacterium]|jgi:hypothetical protein|nr:hypothetical protein [Myxococcota bacterium]
MAGGGGRGEMLAAAASKASGSAKAGLQWGLAALATCVFCYVGNVGHFVAEPSLAMGLAVLLVGASAAFVIVGYVGGEVKPALMVAAIALALAAAAGAGLVGLAPLAGRYDLVRPLWRAALPALVLPALGISAASPPGSREGWRLAHATAVIAAFALILSVQDHSTHSLKHVIGATLGGLLLGPVSIAAAQGLLRAMGVAKPPTRKDLAAAADARGPGRKKSREKAARAEKSGVDA